jgi:quercetin dioxygenase-like cupin family protein
VEIRRFGFGQRRPDGPPGTRGVEGAPIHADSRGVIAELALRPNASISPHTNPNLTYFVVIEGGGFVQVGEERARVAAGEAVVWPPNVIHGAWTELTPMRAIVVEFAGTDALLLEAVVGEGGAAAVERLPGSSHESLKAEGALQPKPEVPPAVRESPEGEPW